MTQVPAGWYPDPAPTQPGQPPQIRYWDGVRWTEHTNVTAPVTPPAQPSRYDQVYGQPYPQGPAYGQGSMYAAGKATTTPDGQQLASWWARAGATVIDWFIRMPVWVLLGVPLYGHLFHEFHLYFEAVQTSVDNGTQGPSAVTFESHILGSIVAIAGLQIVVQLVYSVGFLKWKQATPGKLAMGLRVRLREAPGPLSWKTVWLHWLGQCGPSLLGVIPFVGTVASLYTLIDYLWPAWDDKRQAVHDKVAGTNVVVHTR